MIVQIYEIQTPEEAEQLIALGVDRIGTVLLSESDWMNNTVRKTVDMVRRSRAESSLIPLFSTPDAVFRTIDYYRPDIIHFCEALADENGVFDICDQLVELQVEVKRRFPKVRVMRSIPIAPPGQSERIPTRALARRFEPVSDIFLTDTLLLPEKGDALCESQPVSGFVGITGKICDWDMAAWLVSASKIPVILAGGLDPGNVAEGTQGTRPAGVDSCTGTNARDANGRVIRFKKDMDRVAAFIRAARG